MLHSVIYVVDDCKNCAGTGLVAPHDACGLCMGAGSETTALLNRHVFDEDEYIKHIEVIIETFDKLSPAGKCTVWPPAGCGSGTGLYNMSYEDLAKKIIKLLLLKP